METKEYYNGGHFGIRCMQCQERSVVSNNCLRTLTEFPSPLSLRPSIDPMTSLPGSPCKNKTAVNEMTNKELSRSSIILCVS